MKQIAIIAALLALTGCTSLQYAGNASYKLKPVLIDPAKGTVVCCEVTIADGKERAALDVHVAKTGENYDIIFNERSVTAFQGQVIAASATKEEIDAVAKAAVAAALAPVLPSLIPAIGRIMASGTTGAVVGGVAAGATANKLLTPAAASAQPATAEK